VIGIGDLIDVLMKLGSPTALSYETSWGIEAGAGRYGVTIQGMTLKRDDGEKRTYNFGGAGMGVSISPAKWKSKNNGSITSESFPASGGRVFRGTLNWGAVTFKDLTGPGHIITVSAALGGGACYSIVIMGETVDFLLFSGFMVCGGVELGTPGAGIMCYKGLFALA